MHYFIAPRHALADIDRDFCESIIGLLCGAVFTKVPRRLLSRSLRGGHARRLSLIIIQAVTRMTHWLDRRVDMTSHALSYPVQCRQQEVSLQLNGGASITPCDYQVEGGQVHVHIV